jgi:putative membrane protein
MIMGIIIRLLLNALSVFATSYILNYFAPNSVHLDSFLTAILVAIILGVINWTIKPLIGLLTLPINLVTLGLFSFIINALMIVLVDYLVKGFEVKNFLWALAFSVVLSIINSVVSKFK